VTVESNLNVEVIAAKEVDWRSLANYDLLCAGKSGNSERHIESELAGLSIWAGFQACLRRTRAAMARSIGAPARRQRTVTDQLSQ